MLFVVTALLIHQMIVCAIRVKMSHAFAVKSAKNLKTTFDFGPIVSLKLNYKYLNH